MKQFSCEKWSCTIVRIYHRTIFYADDIALLGVSARKMPKMIEIYKYVIELNPAKNKLDVCQCI